MDNAQEKIGEIIEKSPLPSQLKIYFKTRLEKEGVTPRLIESIKGMLRAAEADAFGRMGVTVDEDDDPEIKRAVKMYSAAVEDAMNKYITAAEDAADKIAKINTKAAKNIEKLESKAIKANVS